jgi:O-antigen/teichoic acid export membrane protein
MFRKFTRDFLIYVPARLLPALTGFISAPILTRLFSPSDYGYYALAMGVVDFLYSLSCSGLSAAYIRFFPAYLYKADMDAFFMAIGFTTGAVIVITTALSFLASVIFQSLLPGILVYPLRIAILIFIFDAIYFSLNGILRSQGKSVIYTTLELSNTYGSLVFGLALVMVFGMRIDGLLWGAFLAFALVAPLAIYFTTQGSKPRLKTFRLEDSRQMWHYAWPIAFGNMSLWGLRLSDRYVIGLLRPESEVGLYSASYNISGKSIDMLVNLIALTAGPMLMNAWEANGRSGAEKTIRMVIRLYLMICLPAATGLTLLAAPFIRLVTGPAYHDGYRVVGFVVFSSFVWGLAGFANYGLLTQKKTKWIAFDQTLAAVVNLVLNIVFVPIYGYVAAGVTTLIGFSIWFGLQYWRSRQFITWQLPHNTIRNILIAVGLMSATIYAFGLISGQGVQAMPVIYMLISILVSVFVYFGALLILGEITPEEKMDLLSLLNRKKNA